MAEHRGTLDGMGSGGKLSPVEIFQKLVVCAQTPRLYGRDFLQREMHEKSVLFKPTLPLGASRLALVYANDDDIMAIQPHGQRTRQNGSV